MANVHLDGRESQFARFLHAQLAPRFDGNIVVLGQNLLYSLIVAPDRDETLPNLGQPSAFTKHWKLHTFETDLLIGPSVGRTAARCRPRVVVELKWGGLNTHDALTYSAKARRHKEIYPYLRYGIVFGGARSFTGEKFLNHNTGFDFAAAFPAADDKNRISETDVEKLAEILGRQLNAATKMAKLIATSGEISVYESGLDIVMAP